MNGDSANLGMWIAVLLALAIFTYLRRRQTYWRRLGIPSAQGSQLLFGNVAGLGFKKQSSDILDPMYYELKRKGLKFGGFMFYVEPDILVVDPELVKAILVRDFHKFHDRGVYVNSDGDPLSAGLFSLTGPQWKSMRQKLTPVFTSGKLKLMFSTMVEVADRMKSFLEHNSHTVGLDIQNVSTRYTVDVIGNIVFGIECNTMKDPESDFSTMGRKALKFNTIRFIKFFVGGYFNNFAKNLGMKIIPTDVANFFIDLTQQSTDFQNSTPTKRNNILNLLLDIKTKSFQALKSEDKIEGLSPNEIAAQCFQFFTAGFETSSTTMTFCLYELALNPDVQNRLREEIQKALVCTNNELTYEAVLSMQYLERIINETLRKYPPVDNIFRVSNSPYQIDGTNFTIPPNTMFRIPAFSLQRDPEHFPDPERFDPDRFLPEAISARHPYVYLPFGEGPRNCIGLRFGLLQTKVGLVTLLRNFRFSPSEATPSRIEFLPEGILLSPKTGLHLKIEPLA